MTKRYGLTKKNGYYVLDRDDCPYGEAYRDGREWVAYSARYSSITATCATLREAAQFLFHG